MKQLKNISNFYNEYKNKNLYSSLITIHGINNIIIKKIELINGYTKYIKLNQISLQNLSLIKHQLIFYFDSEFNKEIKNINKYKKIKNYRGMRHIFKLPIRGQRTHTNAKTIKNYHKTEL